MEAEPASRVDIELFVAWLQADGDQGSASKAAKALADLALKSMAAGIAAPAFNVLDIVDELGHASYDANDTEPARRYLRRIEFEAFFHSRQERFQSWLSLNHPAHRSFVVLRTQGSSGGAGKRKTYSLGQAAMNASPTEAEVEPPSLSTTAIYSMEFCAEKDLSFWGRWLYGGGRVVRGSLRWKFLIGRLMIVMIGVGLLFIGGVLLPLAGTLKGSVGLVLMTSFVIGVAYAMDIKPQLLLVEDRIRMADSTLLRGIEPAQIEIWRNGDIVEWRIVRYVATCPVCAAPMQVDRGEPDFPRRLVGRCRESPREHVYSFDRITRLGRALISPY